MDKRYACSVKSCLSEIEIIRELSFVHLTYYKLR
ncbi:hypothetical protein T03_12027 [Trichinella britovi]|uniref:Uncharacterized protein n=1 Tax=Trichinella britovi TaxID=45882 RepID=A0A0V0ZNJ9_TRIBR|nr:hypothetical protein T03_12027 [Trichinella britovi]